MAFPLLSVFGIGEVLAYCVEQKACDALDLARGQIPLEQVDFLADVMLEGLVCLFGGDSGSHPLIHTAKTLLPDLPGLVQADASFFQFPDNDRHVIPLREENPLPLVRKVDDPPDFEL